jgi:hypothetical protein
MTTSPTPAPTFDLDTLLFVLRERPGANKTDESLALVDPFDVSLPGAGGGSAGLAPAWFDLLGDLQLRLVRDTPECVYTLHASELDDLKLDADQAIAIALANFRRLHGPARVSAWHNLRRVVGANEDVDHAWFIDRALWLGLLAEHPDGLVAALPRTDLLVFAPASDTAAVASMRQGIPGLHAGGADYRLSSALYLFKDGRWTVLQPAVAAPVA